MFEVIQSAKISSALLARGKYAARYAESTSIIVLSPDVAEVFPQF